MLYFAVRSGNNWGVSGQLIRTEMNELGLSAEQVAAEAGCCASTIYKLLRDDPTVSNRIRAKVNRALMKFKSAVPTVKMATG